MTLRGWDLSPGEISRAGFAMQSRSMLQARGLLDGRRSGCIMVGRSGRSVSITLMSTYANHRRSEG